MDLTMRFGGDDTCFIFNLTQNLRFDTLKGVENASQGVEVPVYSHTTLLRDPLNLDGSPEESIDEIDGNPDLSEGGASSDIRFGKLKA